MKYKSSLVILVTATILILLVMFGIYSLEAQTPSYQRYIYHTVQQQSTQWLDSPPYTHINQMDWNNQTGFEDNVKDNRLLVAWVLDRETGIVHELFKIKRSKDYFVWSFSEYRGEDGNPHPNVGRWWLEVDECIIKGGVCE